MRGSTHGEIWAERREEQDAREAKKRFDEWEEGTTPTYAGQPIIHAPDNLALHADAGRHEVLWTRRERSVQAIGRVRDANAGDLWTGVEYSYALADSAEFELLANVRFKPTSGSVPTLPK